MNIIRHESQGSFWEIDEDLMRYRRWPKSEGGRERPEWGGPEAGALQDATWHDFTSWEVDVFGDLRIYHSGSRVITAPPTLEARREVLERLVRELNL